MLSKTPPKNFYITYPSLAKEWHPTKNGSLTPRDPALNFNRRVWWICPNDHVWSATINERIQGTTCPFCAGHKVEDEKITKEPQFAPVEKSHPENSGRKPQPSIKAYPKKKVRPENSLEAVNPELARQWHPTRNKDLTPRDVTAFSHEQVWWLCPKGHEWKAAISSRNNGQGCFYCTYIHKRQL